MESFLIGPVGLKAEDPHVDGQPEGKEKPVEPRARWRHMAAGGRFQEADRHGTGGDQVHIRYSGHGGQDLEPPLQS
ncbi:MAG: hypothetical protein MZV70_44900 [Desulfobacterales bacterium]|nr:hypothetical protein [Desulfobacterales bacterium]